MQALRLAARQAARATARGPVRCKGTVSEEQLFLEFGKAGRQAEPWEGVTYLTYTASFLVMTFGLAYAPRTSIKAWARDEAIALWRSLSLRSFAAFAVPSALYAVDNNLVYLILARIDAATTHCDQNLSRFRRRGWDDARLDAVKRRLAPEQTAVHRGHCCRDRR